ncbi:MAG TPA: MFS transporter [Microvirga sp.]|nr:MFS transporter [Microvirga sp.]
MSFPALLAETIAVQSLGTMAVLIIPALAPAVAQSLDVSTSQVGYQVALVYFAAMLASLAAGAVVASVGPCRTGQIAMLVNAAGCLVASVPHLATVTGGSLLMGSAYGLINPAASQLLVRHSPPGRRNLIFSLKQTGVPIGGMAAGLIGPSVALMLGWSAVLWCVAAACLMVAAASQRGRASLDRDRAPALNRSFLSFASLDIVARHKGLRWLALSSLCFSAVQLCVVAFLVALMVQDLGLDLVEAGAVLASVQVCGALGRVTWGIVADRVRDGIVILLILAGMMIAASAVVVVWNPAWPTGLALVPFLVLGLSAIGWNGVYLSEVARLSPPNSVGAATGAAMFFTFAGVVFGPTAFSFIHHTLGSYLRSYSLLVAISLLGAAMLIAARQGARR